MSVQRVMGCFSGPSRRLHRPMKAFIDHVEALFRLQSGSFVLLLGGRGKGWVHHQKACVGWVTLPTVYVRARSSKCTRLWVGVCHA